MSDVQVNGGAEFGGKGLVMGDIVLETGSQLSPIDSLGGDSLLWNAGTHAHFIP